MKKCINRLEKKDMNILISARGSYDDSASFWTNFIFLKKNLFPKGPQNFLEKTYFRPQNLSGTCPEHDQNMYKNV